MAWTTATTSLILGSHSGSPPFHSPSSSQKHLQKIIHISQNLLVASHFPGMTSKLPSSVYQGFLFWPHLTPPLAHLSTASGPLHNLALEHKG